MMDNMHIKNKIKYIIANSFNALLYAIRFAMYGSINARISKNINKQNCRLFVFGNGPSLKVDIVNNVELLSKEDVLMVNQSATSDLFFQIKPCYYLLMDPVYFGVFPKEEKESMKFQQMLQDLRDRFEKIDFNMTLFVPYTLWHNKSNHILKNIVNPYIKIKTFNAVETYSFIWLEKFLYSHNLAIPSGINVLIPSLCMGIAIGYKRIYLLGADSNWHKQLEIDNATNKLYSNEMHYYRNKAEKYYVHDNVYINFQSIANAFKAYLELGKLEFNIMNLSSNSMIDAFPRDSLTNIIAKDNCKDKET